jgi:hypothetical protein
MTTPKTITTKAKLEIKATNDFNAVTSEEPTPEPLGQRKRPEKGQFWLQVDRQTKGSYATYEAAEQAALAIKTGHPIVRVAIYDTVACVNKLIELPE